MRQVPSALVAVAREEAELAYAYAWWLTGDPELAAAAVATALEEPGLGDAPAPRVREQLLRAVRSCAISAPTMCPASEVALLHDVSGLALPIAAQLASIAEPDATTELAHGRLEALPNAVDVVIAHPERLGGLAVGNPADVAHARQCASCGRMRELLLAGREQLSALPAPAAPASIAALGRRLAAGGEDATIDVREVIVAEPPRSRRERKQRGERRPEPAPAVEEAPAAEIDQAPTVDEEPSPAAVVEQPALEAEEEPPLTAEEEPPPAVDEEPSTPHVEEEPKAPAAEQEPATVEVVPAPALDERHEAIDVREHLDQVEPVRPPRRRVWGVLAMLAIAGAIAIVASQGASLLPDNTPEEQESAAASPAADAAPTASLPPTAPTPTGPVDPVSGLELVAAGLQIDDALVTDNPAIDAFDPLRIQLDYRGIITPAVVQVVWAVDGQPFRELMVELSARRETHLFGAPVPDDGWPPGQHVLALSANASPLGEVDFVVAPAPTPEDA